MEARRITFHELTELNNQLTILVTDQPGPGGANHSYYINGPSRQIEGCGMIPSFQCHIRFQKGPIKEAGVNGVSHEALLAIIIDRLTSFQEGPYACPENAAALRHCDLALAALMDRTKKRMERGVEGTSTK